MVLLLVKFTIVCYISKIDSILVGQLVPQP